MKPETLRLELEQLVERNGYSIRKERGSFSGNHCIMEGDRLVVLNTKKPIEQQLGLLARVLHQTGVRDIYVKPAVRKELERFWEQLGRFEDHENKSNESAAK